MIKYPSSQGRGSVLCQGQKELEIGEEGTKRPQFPYSLTQADEKKWKSFSFVLGCGGLLYGRVGVYA